MAPRPTDASTQTPQIQRRAWGWFGGGLHHRSGMDHRGSRRPACGGAPLKHLDGQARCEVLAQAPVARAIARDVLGLLWEAFGDQ